MSDDFARNFALKPVAAMVVAAGAVGLAPHEVMAQKPGQNTTDIIAKGDFGLKYAPTEKAKADELVDFDVAKTLAGKPYILIEGYNGCKFCDKIAQNVGKIRVALDQAGKTDVPIVLINVQPETDRKSVEEYMTRYAESKAYGKAEEIGKTFFMVFPKDRDAAVKLQQGIEAAFNREDPNSHGMKIAVVNSKGVCTAAALGTSEGAKSDALVTTITKSVSAGLGK